MNEQKAREILGNWIDVNNNISSTGPHVTITKAWKMDAMTAYLHGHFDADKLEAMAWWIRNFSTEGGKNNA